VEHQVPVLDGLDGIRIGGPSSQIVGRRVVQIRHGHQEFQRSNDQASGAEPRAQAPEALTKVWPRFRPLQARVRLRGAADEGYQATGTP
jgi:hypothetical protein